MRVSFAKCFATVAFATLHLTASASLIEPLEYESKGLTWLRLSETAGLSLNDFATGVGGWNSKYRFALNTEIDSLLSSFGLGLVDTGYARSVPGVSDFVFKFGGVTGYGTAGTYFDDGNQGALGRGLGRFAVAQLTNGDNGSALSEDCAPFTSCSRFFATAGLEPPNDRQSHIGLFLIGQDVVEPPVGVPEPSSIMLMAIAGLALVRRRKS